jgi:hypothetical protein
MTRRNIAKYMPSEETMRRVGDRAASDENMQRALENVELLETIEKQATSEVLPTEGPTVPVPETAPAPSAPARETAADPSDARPGFSIPRRVVWVALAVLSVMAPAVLLVGLLLQRGSSESGSPQATTATASQEAPPVTAPAAAPAASTAPEVEREPEGNGAAATSTRKSTPPPASAAPPASQAPQAPHPRATAGMAPQDRPALPAPPLTSTAMAAPPPHHQPAFGEKPEF